MAATEAPVFAGDQHIIERPRLTRMLDQSKAKVVLLLAPAGYGKTTLARQWLRDKPHVWYRATEADADVAALAVGLAAQAAVECPGVDERLRRRMRGASDPEREAGVLSEILAEDFDRLPRGTWIAIDDYHYVNDSAASELFIRLLVEASATRFVLTTRRRPSWATARAVVYGGTVIVAKDDLAMTENEAGRVVRNASTGPALCREVQGWPAALGLAARVGSSRIEAPLAADLYDFFTEELWRGLPQDLQWEVIQLALISPTPWTIAEDIFGDSAAELLRSDFSVGWVSREGSDILIHPLLRRFLRARFDEFPSTRRRTALETLVKALTRRNHWDQAMALAFELDERAVSALLVVSLDVLLDAGRLSTIERWLALARDKAMDSPVLKLAAAEVAFRRGQYVRAEALGEGAAREFSDPALRARSLNRAGMSATLLDRLDLALSLHKEARACAQDQAALRDSIIGQIGASLDMGARNVDALLAELPDGGSATDRIRVAGTRLLVALRVGDVSAELERSSGVVSVLADVRDPLARTSFLYLRAGVLVAAAMYRDALKTIATLEDDASAYGIDLARVPAKILRAVAEAGLRNFVHAKKITQDVLAETQRDGDLFLYGVGCAAQARIEAASASGETPPHHPEIARVTAIGVYEEYLASLALAAAASGDRVRAEVYADEARAGVATADTDVVLAWVHAMLSGDPSDAVTAFDLTRGRGLFDACVVSYRAHSPFVADLMSNPSYRDALKALMIRANDRELFQHHDLTSASANPWRQRLTRREREVYSLMVDGLTNRRIAERLVITESTAKLHVRHILDKLCARTRAEAVAKWRDVLED